MTSGPHGGARVIFSGGHASISPAITPPDGWLPAAFSVISPGTERRRLAATVTGPDHAAGYMTATDPDDGGGFMLAPVPHGAPVPAADPRALRIPAGTAVEHVAIARFQLMAALGLARCLPAIRSAPSVLVIGGGPVAMGCVLELRSLAVPRIRVVTRHRALAVASLPGVTVSPAAERAAEPLVIDCTGRLESALRAAAPGGFVGLLGTPAESATLPAATIHRDSVTVAGMHELAARDKAAYHTLFARVLEEVTSGITVMAARSWCRRVPGERAADLYAELQGGRRPAEPFLLLEWFP